MRGRADMRDRRVGDVVSSRAIRALVATVIVLAASLVIGELSGSSPRTSTSSAHGGRGFRYDPPRRATPGDYEPPFDESTFRSGLKARDEDVRKAQFTGLHPSGIFVQPGTPAVTPCPGGLSAVLATELAGELLIPQPPSLPDGAFEPYAQWASTCGELVNFVERVFELSPGGGRVVILYKPTSLAMRAQASADRVESGEVHGRPAVFIRPVASSGYGNSWIATRIGVGLIQVSALHLPFDDLEAIANEVVAEMAA